MPKKIPTLLLSFLAGCFTSAQGEKSAYWAYQPLAPITPPKIDDPFIQNPIDAFILASLREKNLTPNPPAPDSVLHRRLAYDLTGLPPQKTSLPWPELVDQYLDSPQFGEKFASHWLDLVRYAETNGFERDSLKPAIWQYRDYVIRAFNENKPYDRFLTEHLAGDLLPDRNLDSALATGFMTLMQRDDEPADKPQAHADVISDIADLTGEAFMGTTMGCAKCHDHKGDPITQADYFSLRAFFEGIKQDLFKEPSHTWIDPEAERNHQQKRDENLAQIHQLWSQVDPTALDPYLKKSPDPAPIETQFLFRPGAPDDPTWSLPSFDAPAQNFTPFTQTTPNQPLTLRSEFGLQEIPTHFLLYLQGDLKNLQVFLNGSPIHTGLPEKINGQTFIPLPTTELTTGKNALGLITESSRPPLTITLTHKPLIDLTPDQFALLYPAFIAQTFGPDFAQKMSPLQEERHQLTHPVTGLAYHSIHELPRDQIPAPVIHERGSVHAPGREVPIAFPVVLDPAQATPTRSRLELAQWLTDPSHPLTARVWVNRLWQYTFGRGLVESANDFGVLGTGPSNQALLDWLAQELIRSGWDTKHLLRLLVNSSTYRLSSFGQNDLDPENRLHWRFNPRRLTAEEIWDTYLLLTRQMNLKMGGPPVRPAMPAAVLQTSSRPHDVWPPSAPEEASRRALYIHVKRSIQLPILANFDAPQRDLSCPTRFATIVPTQALTMLNSERMNEFADLFAQALDPAPLPAQIDQAFLLATHRPITEGERHELLALAQDLQTTHQIPPTQIMPRLALLLLNLNETLYLD